MQSHTLYFTQPVPESIERFREDQAVSTSYALAPPPPHTPSAFLSKSSTNWKTGKERQLTDWRGGDGVGEGAKSYDGKKAWSSKNHSMLFESMPSPCIAAAVLG